MFPVNTIFLIELGGLSNYPYMECVSHHGEEIRPKHIVDLSTIVIIIFVNVYTMQEITREFKEALEYSEQLRSCLKLGSLRLVYFVVMFLLSWMGVLMIFVILYKNLRKCPETSNFSSVWLYILTIIKNKRNQYLCFLRLIYA